LNPDVFAGWLGRQGHHIVRTASCYWHSQGPRVYQAFPYHWVIRPPEDELMQFLREYRVFGLRYSTPVDGPEGAISYHAVYECPSYGFENLTKWGRKNVRRGLKNCVVKPISFERLAREGWALQLDTLDRQGRQLRAVRETWNKRCLAAADLPGFEAWGACVGDHLAASVITFQMDDCAYMLYQQCRRDFLPEHVNNALSFVVTQTLVSRPEIHSILYGLHSLDAPPSVDEFKFRMGYTARPVRQRVVFHPWLAPLFNRASHAAVKQLRHWLPGNPTLAKAEGLLRFYLEGRRPLDQQGWPLILTRPAMERDVHA
jgi:hypothetical protein